LWATGKAAAAIARLPRTNNNNFPQIKAQSISQLGLAELPGAAEAYSSSTATWETRPQGEDTRVAILGDDGLLGGVTKASPQPKSAQQLLIWLSSSSISSRVFPGAASAGPFRRSHAADVVRWLPADEMWNSLGPAFAEVAWKTESHSTTIYPPRCGIATELMNLLDRAVLNALKKESSPTAALDSCAKEWAELISRQPSEPLQRVLKAQLGNHRVALTHSIRIQPSQMNSVNESVVSNLAQKTCKKSCLHVKLTLGLWHLLVMLRSIETAVRVVRTMAPSSDHALSIRL
jgi:hypothetical protein